MKGKKRASILDSARQMFRRYGIRKTNLNEIARVSRVAKATIYNYFGSKEQVYLEVLTEEVNELIGRISEAIGQIRSPLGKLRTFCRTRFNQMKEPSYMLNAPGDEAEAMMLRASGVVEHFSQKEISVLQGILEEGIREGVFRVGSAVRTARVFRYALKGMESALHPAKCREEVEKDFEELFDILCRGILAEKSEA